MTTRTETGRKLKRKNPFVMMDVTSLRDTRLSWKAKGLMTYFLDKPDNWEYILEHLYKQAPEKRASVASGLRELRTYGYLVRVAYRKGNRVSSHGFLVYETPVKYPSVSPIHVDKLAWEKHLLSNEDDIDITIFAKAEKERKEREKANRAKKTPKTLDTPLESGFLQAENLRAGNQPLLSTYIYTDEPSLENIPRNFDEIFEENIPEQRGNLCNQQQQTKVDQTVVVGEQEPKPQGLTPKSLQKEIETQLGKSISISLCEQLFEIAQKNNFPLTRAVFNTIDKHDTEPIRNPFGAIRHAIENSPDGRQGGWDVPVYEETQSY